MESYSRMSRTTSCRWRWSRTSAYASEPHGYGGGGPPGSSTCCSKQKQSIFEKKVAHGYFVLSAAAGLFVDPAPGPVLANYGLENLRFVKPVYPGDAIQVKLTCKQKTVKDTPAQGLGAGIPQGVVSWDVEVTNQDEELAATYTILTLVRRRG